MTNEDFIKFRKYFRFSFRIIIFIIILIILNQYLIFSGETSSTQDFSDSKSRVSNIKPDENITKLKEGNNYVIDGSEIYFFVIPIDKPEKIEVNIEIENPTPVANLAIENNDGSFSNKMVYNVVMETVKNDPEWTQVKDEEVGISLWCKKDEICSIKDYFDNFSYNNTYFAVNNFNFVSIPNYDPQENFIKYELPMRGHHTIYTYIGDGEDLAWKFEYKDVGKSSGSELFPINLYSGNEMIDQTEFDRTDDVSFVEYNKHDLPEGIYKIEIPMSADTRLISFETKQEYFAISELLDLDNHRQSSELFLIGDYVKFQTVHKQGLQTLYFNDQPVLLQKTREMHEQNIFPSGINDFKLDKNDITIKTDGLIFLNKKNRDFTEFLYYLLRNQHEKFVIEDYENLISTNDYNPPEQIQDGLKLNAQFDVQDVKLTKKDRIKFYLSAPQYFPKDKLLKIKEISVKIYRPIIPYLRNFFQK